MATFRFMAHAQPEEPPEETHPPSPQPAPEAQVAEGRRERGRDARHFASGPKMLKSEDGMVLRDNVFGTPRTRAPRLHRQCALFRRQDFSIIDHVGGMEDLKTGLIRTIGDPLVRFTEDPVRIIRAVRFGLRDALGFNIEERTAAAMTELAGSINKATPPRLDEEVLKLLMLGAGERTYQMMRHRGLFEPLFPHFDAGLTRGVRLFPARAGRQGVSGSISVAKGCRFRHRSCWHSCSGNTLREKVVGSREGGRLAAAGDRGRHRAIRGRSRSDRRHPEPGTDRGPGVLLPSSIFTRRPPGENGRGVVESYFPGCAQLPPLPGGSRPRQRSLADWWQRFAADWSQEACGGSRNRGCAWRAPGQTKAQKAAAQLPAPGSRPEFHPKGVILLGRDFLTSSPLPKGRGVFSG